MLRNDFYVYALLDPRKPGRFSYGPWSFLFEPFYVGKGCGKRARRFLQGKSHRTNRIKAIIADGCGEPIVLKLHEGLTEVDAFAGEIAAIATIGRIIRKTGPLVNKQRGGSGYARRNPRPPTPEQTRKKISASLTGRPLPEATKQKLRGRSSWNKGIPASPQERERLRRIRSVQTNNSGPPKGSAPWNLGKSMSAETYQKCAATMFKFNPDAKCHQPKKKWVEHWNKGRRSPNKGKPRSPETIAKIKATKAANKKRAA